MPRFRHRLDLQLFSGEKTEKATPKKRGDARGKGQVAKSPEIPSSLILLGGICCFLAFGSFYQDRILRMFGDTFLNRLTMEITAQNVGALFYHFVVQMLIFLAPILIMVVLVSFAASYVQFGWLVTLEPLKMSLTKLDPVKGFQNLFSLRSLIELLKSALKLTLIGLVVYGVLWTRRDQFMDLAHVPIEGAFAFAANLTVQLGLMVAALLFVLSIGDYMFAKYEYEKSLRMSKQDIKDEHKNMEGDPLIKRTIRQKQMQMAIRRMMQEVPNADVVITNPTHFAVALKYDGTKMEAPTVVAKGQDYLALRIREIAKKHDVATMENKPLARALYERTEVGDVIPFDLFQAVAEVLAYVYRLKGRRQA